MLDTASAERLSDREVVFTRSVDAPCERVWMIWTELRHLHQWWGPAGFTTTTHEFTFAPGGVWRFVMHGPDGTDYPNRIVFREIDPPSRIVYENGWDLPGMPLDFTVVVSFEPQGAKTRFSLHMTFRDADALRTAVERYGVMHGGIQTLDRLAQYAEESG
ncbi:MAG TPA: SRPBCC domain-containing protein [Gemmatimonadaceae bacterium]